MMLTKTKIACLHASPGAIGPVTEFYRRAAPELEVVHLFDGGLLPLLDARQFDAAEVPLRRMIDAAAHEHRARLVLLTCTAVPPETLARLRSAPAMPIVKIDESLARRAVHSGRRIGVVVTFPATLEIVLRQLSDAAGAAGRLVETISRLVPDAHRALLANDEVSHDRQVLGAMAELAAQEIDALVLAQVSMSRVLSQWSEIPGLPVLTSLDTSLQAVREALRNPA